MNHRWMLAVGLLLGPCGTAIADDASAEVSALLVTTKFVGHCEAFTQMMTFQAATDVPGGEDFLVKYLHAEATRLGIADAEYVKRCKLSRKAYKQAMDTLAAQSKPPG